MVCEKQKFSWYTHWKRIFFLFFFRHFVRVFIVLFPFFWVFCSYLFFSFFFIFYYSLWIVLLLSLSHICGLYSPSLYFTFTSNPLIAICCLLNPDKYSLPPSADPANKPSHVRPKIRRMPIFAFQNSSSKRPNSAHRPHALYIKRRGRDV